MSMKPLTSLAAAMTTAATLCLAAPAHATELIVNGGFELGFASWIHVDSLGSDGSFFVQSGTASPLNGDPVPAPPGGTNAAMSDAQGPGSHVLYQDFVVPLLVANAALDFDQRAAQLRTGPEFGMMRLQEVLADDGKF